jgi:UDP:flavonoid glycosyltransferase YjiC (YdhE family)
MPAGVCLLSPAARSDSWIVVTESVLTRTPAALPEDVHRLRHFPIGEYRNAFDASVMAAGYNSFHESMSLGLPTLFVPNIGTAKDDQDARARWAEASGTGLRWDETTGDSDDLQAAIDQLVDPARQEALRAKMADLPTADGAREIAEALVGWGQEAV